MQFGFTHIRIEVHSINWMLEKRFLDGQEHLVRGMQTFLRVNAKAKNVAASRLTRLDHKRLSEFRVTNFDLTEKANPIHMTWQIRINRKLTFPICRNGIDALKSSFVVAYQTTRMLVMKKEPKFP